VSADRRRAAPEPAEVGSGDAVERTESERLADHAAIDRLTDDLVPALVAKLSASGLGEIEVGEGSWTVRVRRPADGAPGQARRAAERGSRTQPGHAPGGFEAHRGTREARAGGLAAASSSNGSGPGATGATGRGEGDDHRSVATSPAVGIFQPRPEIRPGTRVRSGDRLGAVDILGVPQEVVAPADGIVGATLVEAGQAVEYGQELIVIELAARSGDPSRAGDAGRAAERSEA
jgi:biotin carboxyl carrier protein